MKVSITSSHDRAVRSILFVAVLASVLLQLCCDSKPANSNGAAPRRPWCKNGLYVIYKSDEKEATRVVLDSELKAYQIGDQPGISADWLDFSTASVGMGPNNKYAVSFRVKEEYKGDVNTWTHRHRTQEVGFLLDDRIVFRETMLTPFNSYFAIDKFESQAAARSFLDRVKKSTQQSNP